MWLCVVQVYPDSNKVLIRATNISGGIFLSEQGVHYLHGEGGTYTPKIQP